jgi:sensor domain CHASE-containing protein
MKHLVIITLIVLMFAVSAMATKTGIDTITDYAAQRNEEIADI